MNPGNLWMSQNCYFSVYRLSFIRGCISLPPLLLLLRPRFLRFPTSCYFLPAPPGFAGRRLLASLPEGIATGIPYVEHWDAQSQIVAACKLQAE